MISLLSGTIADKTPTSLIIDVHDVGYEVAMTKNDVSHLRTGQEVTLYTHMTISQDAVTLYGFQNNTAKALFLKLQKTSGVGPKAALSLLDVLSPDALVTAINNGDVNALTKAQGIGKKGAQKIILELSADMSNFGSLVSQESPEVAPQKYSQEVVTALTTLGWQPQQAELAVESIKKDAEYENDIPRDAVGEILRKALAYLAKEK